MVRKDSPEQRVEKLRNATDQPDRSAAREFYEPVTEFRESVGLQIELCGRIGLPRGILKCQRCAICIAPDSVALGGVSRRRFLSNEGPVTRALHENVIFPARLAAFKGDLFPIRALIARTQVERPVMLKSGRLGCWRLDTTSLSLFTPRSEEVPTHEIQAICLGIGR